MNYQTLVVFFLISLPLNGLAQKNSMEIGVGIGNVTNGEHRLGKAEVHFGIFRDLSFGQLGLDFSSGGNFIPGESGLSENNKDILSPKDSRFSSIALLYRIPVHGPLFVEPRLGYASLSAFVHADDQQKIRRANFSAGLGFGASLGGLRLSLRYQHLGNTADFSGFRGSTEVISPSAPVPILLLRMSYSFRL